MRQKDKQMYLTSTLFQNNKTICYKCTCNIFQNVHSLGPSLTIRYSPLVLIQVLKRLRSQLNRGPTLMYLFLTSVNSWLNGTMILSTCLLKEYCLMSMESSVLSSMWEISRLDRTCCTACKKVNQNLILYIRTPQEGHQMLTFVKDEKLKRRLILLIYW